MPHAATYSVPVIRTNFGSHRRVVAVTQYKPSRRIAVCRMADGEIDDFTLDELEAIDSNRNYLDLDRALREAAHEIIE